MFKLNRVFNYEKTRGVILFVMQSIANVLTPFNMIFNMTHIATYLYLPLLSDPNPIY